VEKVSHMSSLTEVIKVEKVTLLTLDEEENGEILQKLPGFYSPRWLIRQLGRLLIRCPRRGSVREHLPG
jgi:hypothetical protein